MKGERVRVRWRVRNPMIDNLCLQTRWVICRGWRTTNYEQETYGGLRENWTQTQLRNSSEEVTLVEFIQKQSTLY